MPYERGLGQHPTKPFSEYKLIGLDRLRHQTLYESVNLRYFLLFLREVFFLEPFFGATFLPLLRASDRPIAIACFLLFTVLPLRPLLSEPFLRRCIALLTSLEALVEVLRATIAPDEMLVVSNAKSFEMVPNCGTPRERNVFFGVSMACRRN